jgi:acyl carrier protein
VSEAGIPEKTVHALSEVLGLDEGEIALDATLVGDLQATSLDVVDLLYQLKKAFGIELTLAEVQRELAKRAGGRKADANGGTEGFDDTLFQGVTVRDIVEWVTNRLPA